MAKVIHAGSAGGRAGGVRAVAGDICGGGGCADGECGGAIDSVEGSADGAGGDVGGGVAGVAGTDGEGKFVVRGSNMSLIVAGGSGGLNSVTSRNQGCDANKSRSGSPGSKPDVTNR